METGPPEEESLKVGSFATHSARGVIRDPRVRRKTMFALLAIAVLMVITGATVLQEFLNPRDHAIRFILFWLACGWVTITSLLLALFDVLMARAQARAARRMLREQMLGDPDEDDDARGDSA
ncbi:MAG: hypothetical protein H0W20_15170 [Chthoniobacterales bacterium]|nr:hypothetical protein [Chthoniobacterales bacterium]